MNVVASAWVWVVNIIVYIYQLPEDEVYTNPEGIKLRESVSTAMKEEHPVFCILVPGVSKILLENKIKSFTIILLFRIHNAN